MDNKKTKDLLNVEPQWQFDKDAINQKQAKLRIFLEKATKDNTVLNYDSIKYKGNIYQIGNYLQIWDASLKEPYVGRLIRIVEVDKSLEKMPFIQIEWCLKKKDLPHEIIHAFGKHISIAQIFPSKLKYCISIPGIKGKCQLFSLQQYGQMAISHPNYYFTRSQYDQEKRQLVPHPNKWTTQCFCGAPQNPDLVYVNCDKCQKWFHDDCIGVEEKDLGDSYICKNCKENSSMSDLFSQI